jgi:ubiquinone/menaquinone biosynthesis C-methylase UbiE
LNDKTADHAPAEHTARQGQPQLRSLNEATGRKEFIFREGQLSADLPGELQKALAKFKNDGRKKNLEILRQRGIDLRGLILELGAGTCWFSSEISKNHNVTHVYALDFAKSIMSKMAPMVMDHLGADTTRITRVIGDFNQLPFPGRAFDFVVVDAALHHAIRTEAVLEEIGRVLKDDGRLLAIREPVLPSWRKNLRKTIGAQERAQGVTENVFSKKEWRACFEKARLDVRFIPARPTHQPVRWKNFKKLAWFLFVPWLNSRLFGYYYFLAKKKNPTQ